MTVEQKNIIIYWDKREMRATVPNDLTLCELADVFQEVTQVPISKVAIFAPDDETIGELMERGREGRIKPGDEIILNSPPRITLNFRR